MNIKDIIKGCVFQQKSKNNCLVEILKVEEPYVRVVAYNINGSENDVVDISDLKEIPLSIPILKSLGFEEKEGILMGVPNEHYWQKLVNEHFVWIVDEKGTLKYATIDSNAYFGIKYTPTPYLHELQNVIGPINVAKLLKDLKKHID